MFARVLTSTGPDIPELAQQFADRIALDGCEGCWMVADSDRDEYLTFTLYRDQAAANAGVVAGDLRVFGRVFEGRK